MFEKNAVETQESVSRVPSLLGALTVQPQRFLIGLK